HLEPQEDTLRIRYRIDGMLYDFMTMPKERSVPVISRLKILAGMDISERRRPQDGHISMQADGREIDLRLATLPTVLGEKIVLRVLEETSVLKGLNQLGFESDDLEKVRKAVHAPNGMVLVTGPIGSGKTTTLYSALTEVNVQTRNIVTIEDPVEYQLPGINQVQVDPKINLTFAEGLRAVLRQDANVLMVGEIRDVETAKVAVRAALTGHLLLSTLHTNSALGAISTLYHLGIEPILLSSAVSCVIAQRLVRKVCQQCCQMRLPAAGLRSQLGLPASSKKKIPYAKGCKECFHTGYSGRTAVYEVICVSDNLREMILQGASESAMIEAAKKDKSSFLLENGKKKVLEGITTFEELVRTIYM
ncbi:MAG TPA: GspE/PulE family protein, partial [bacterium]|nr:GspE/PulE family protein [bacterium]